MSVSYSKLWKMLIDKKMSKADLRKAAGLAPNTMTKLRRDEEVKLSILCRICAVLHVNFGDIIDFVPSDAEKENRDIIAEQSEKPYSQIGKEVVKCGYEKRKETQGVPERLDG